MAGRGRPAGSTNSGEKKPRKSADARVKEAAARVHKSVDKSVANMAATMIRSGGSIDSPAVQNLVKASREFLKSLQDIATGKTDSE
jgi:hypothetical protein